MTAITVRQLPEGVKHRLRMRAAANGRSMEAEARSILVSALAEERAVDFTWIDKLVAAAGETGVLLPEAEEESAPAADFGR